MGAGICVSGLGPRERRKPRCGRRAIRRGASLQARLLHRDPGPLPRLRGRPLHDDDVHAGHPALRAPPPPGHDEVLSLHSVLVIRSALVWPRSIMIIDSEVAWELAVLV